MHSGTDDQQRVATLYRQYGRIIFSRCRELLRDDARAEDATQEVFLKVLRHLDTFDEGRDPMPWLFGIATWHCIDLIRQQARRQQKEEALGLATVLEGIEFQDLLADRQLATQLLERFDARTQAIAVAVLVDGREHQEVAQTLGVSTKTIARKLERFLDHARKFLLRSTP